MNYEESTAADGDGRAKGMPMHRGGLVMEKSMKSEGVKRRKWTKREVEAVQRAAALQANEDDSGINFEDIPRLSKAQLESMVRLRDRKKIAVSVRLDPQVLAWLKSKGSGHLTRINDILTNLMEADLRAKHTG